jgi:hypothetical protein
VRHTVVHMVAPAGEGPHVMGERGIDPDLERKQQSRSRRPLNRQAAKRAVDKIAPRSEGGFPR